MVTAVGLGTNGFYSPMSGAASQYMDSSLFSAGTYGATGMMGYGYGYGYGLGNDSIYNYTEHAIDNQTSLNFAVQGNQYTLNSYNDIMRKELPAMSNAIKEGDFGKATQIYKSIYNAISKKNGEELNEQGQRVAYDQSIKAEITRAYRMINGTNLADDITASGEGYFSNGFMQGLTLNDHHKNSAEETISYMTGEGIEGYSGKKFIKGVGKVAGATVSIAGAAGVGAAIGSIIPCIGTGIGAVIGGGVALTKMLLSNNTPNIVTEG